MKFLRKYTKQTWIKIIWRMESLPKYLYHLNIDISGSKKDNLSSVTTRYKKDSLIS